MNRTQRRQLKHWLPALMMALLAVPVELAAAGRGNAGARQANRESRQSNRQSNRETRQDNRQANRAAERQSNRSERQENRSERRENRQERRSERSGERTDRRQERQDRRIEHGIDKGYLTENEVAELKSQEEALAAKEAQYKSDGRLNKQERTDLRVDLNQMSREIWVQKHDTEGGQMPVYALSRKTSLKPEVADMLQDENVSKAMARKTYRDMANIKELQRKLAGDDLSEDQMAAAQKRYDRLVGKYFDVAD